MLRLCRWSWEIFMRSTMECLPRVWERMTVFMMSFNSMTKSLEATCCDITYVTTVGKEHITQCICAEALLSSDLTWSESLLYWHHSFWFQSWFYCAKHPTDALICPFGLDDKEGRTGCLSLLSLPCWVQNTAKIIQIHEFPSRMFETTLRHICMQLWNCVMKIYAVNNLC